MGAIRNRLFPQRPPKLSRLRRNAYSYVSFSTEHETSVSFMLFAPRLHPSHLGALNTRVKEAYFSGYPSGTHSLEFRCEHFLERKCPPLRSLSRRTRVRLNLALFLVALHSYYMHSLSHRVTDAGMSPHVRSYSCIHG